MFETKLYHVHLLGFFAQNREISDDQLKTPGIRTFR